MSFHHSKSKLGELEKPPHLFLNADGIKKRGFMSTEVVAQFREAVNANEDWQAVAGDIHTSTQSRQKGLARSSHTMPEKHPRAQ